MSELKRKPNLKNDILGDEVLKSISAISGTTFYASGTTVLDLLLKQPVEGCYLHFSGDKEALLHFFDNDPIGRKFNLIAYHEISETWACSVEGKNVLISHYNSAQALSKGIKNCASSIGIPVLSLYVPLNGKSPGKIFSLHNGYEDYCDKSMRLGDKSSEAFWNHPSFLLSLCYYVSRYDLTPDESILQAMQQHVVGTDVTVTAGSTIFFKILGTSHPSNGVKLLHESGLLKKFFPEASNMAGVEPIGGYQHKDVFYHTCEVVDNISRTSDDVWLRFAAFVHDIAKPHTKKFIEGTGWTFHGHEEKGARLMKGMFYRLGLDKEKLPYVQKMIRLHLRPSALVGEGITDSAVRRLITEAGDHLDDLLKLCRADITSKNPGKVSRVRRNYDVVEAKILAVKAKDELAAFQSPVRGEEIMQICGLKPSRKVGEIKTAIEDAILKGEIENTYGAALQYLMQIKDSLK
jgi:poly(A) polymerase